MPQNLEDKSDAFYRRLLILDMNRVVKSGEKDLHAIREYLPVNLILIFIAIPENNAKKAVLQSANCKEQI